MPVLSPPPKTVVQPSNPPAAKPPSRAPSPRTSNLNIFKNAPGQIPGFRPSTALRSTPVALGVTVLVEVERNVTECLVGARLEVERKFPEVDRDKDTIFRPKRKRRRPCHGTGKPTITYEFDPAREIGTFTLPRASKLWSKSQVKSRENLVKDKTLKVAEREGLEKGEGEPVWSELSRPKSPLEIARFYFLIAQGGGECFYRVYHRKKRRVCTCPDGSKCKSTTVR